MPGGLRSDAQERWMHLRAIDHDRGRPWNPQCRGYASQNGWQGTVSVMRSGMMVLKWYTLWTT